MRIVISMENEARPQHAFKTDASLKGYGDSLALLCVLEKGTDGPALSTATLPGLVDPGQYTATMAAGHLRLALALMLGLASASKRPRDSDSGQREFRAFATTTATATTTTTATPIIFLPGIPSSTIEVIPIADPKNKDDSLYLFKRAIQTAGCLFNDAVACSGGFDDPTGHAAILISSILARKNPRDDPVQPLGGNLGPLEQLRHELLQLVHFKRGDFAKVARARADELQLIAIKQLVSSTLWAASDKNLVEDMCSTISVWDKNKAFSQRQLSGLDELFMATDKITTGFDRSVFVWPSGQSSSDPLHPEERLYAAAVVVMCKRLGVRPVSVFLVTRKFGSSLTSGRRNEGINWRRPTFQVIATAARKTVRGLDMAEACRSLIDRLGISEQLHFVPQMTRHRRQSPDDQASRPESDGTSALAEPAEPPMPPAPLNMPLPTALGEGFAETDRLLLIRSLQVAYLLLNQTAADQCSFCNLFFQASIVISHLLRLNDHGVPSDLIKHRPGLYFTPLDLLRVIAEADRRPDLSAVATAGDVMTLAARMIFRHLHLSLPVTLLAQVEQFNAIRSRESYPRQLLMLTNHLSQQRAPYILSNSSASAHLYDMTDVILWAAFRAASVQRGSSSEAFVLCTREMLEQIPAASQYTYYLIPAILRAMFGNRAESIEIAITGLFLQPGPASKNSGSLQTPAATPKMLTVANQLAGISAQVTKLSSQLSSLATQTASLAGQVAHGHSEVIADHILVKATVIMRTLFQGGSLMIRSLRDIPSMVLAVVPNDLAKAGELTSVNRLAATSQLHALDAKLKRDRIPFSDTDHVTVLIDALVALHFLQQGAAAQLAGIPRTRMSDIGTEDKGSLALLLVIALFKATSVQLIEGSMSAAFSDLTARLTSAVEATAAG